MAVSKEFLEAVSNDKDLEAEVNQATFDALAEFLKEKGLEDEAREIMEAATEKVAEAHGFEPADPNELDLEDLEGIVGGMRVVVIKSPKILSPILRMIFKIKKDE